MGRGLVGGAALGRPYRKGVGEMLFRQWGIICRLAVRWERVTSKTARDGNKSLLGATSGLPLSLSHLSRCPLELEGLGDVDVGESPSVQERLPKASQSDSRSTTVSVRKKRGAVVIGDSFLRGTKGLICCSDQSHREVCCLPGAWVRDVARNVTCLVKPSDYYPLLSFHIGNEEIGKRSPRVIRRDFRGL